MAQATALKTYDVVGNREDLTDLISTITRAETPIFSSLPKTRARSTYHETQKDDLATGSDNAQIEGLDYVFAVPDTRERIGGYTQIFTKTVKVSKTQQAVTTAGVDNEFAYQTQKRMKEIATDVEKALITGTGNSGASGTPRRIKGLLSRITTNVETGTGTGNEALTEDMYNDLLQTIWTAGGRPDVTYVGGAQKRVISSFTANSTRFSEVDEQAKLINKVTVYESDFGMQKIMLNPFMPADQALVLQTDAWAVAVLRPIEYDDVPSIGSYKAGVIEGELALEERNEATSGKITGLS